jgi:hypothetical protein
MNLEPRTSGPQNNAEGFCIKQIGNGKIRIRTSRIVIRNGIRIKYLLPVSGSGIREEQNQQL